MAENSLHPIVTLKKCKGCMICIAFCPKKVFSANRDMKPIIERPEDCVGCRQCEYRCPDFAIELK